VRDDPPHPVTVLRRFLGGGALLTAIALGAVFLDAGRIEWRLVALLTVLTGALGFASDVIDGVGSFLRLVLEGGATPTHAEEADALERRLASRPPPDKEILWGVRLAELYRRHLGEPERARAVLDRLLVKYPDSRELRHARGLTVGAHPAGGG
jgi:hypothetical protein